jgi:hypothetical protein
MGGYFYKLSVIGCFCLFILMEMAEGVGFEPTLGSYPKHAFQACALSHSATPPVCAVPRLLRHGGRPYSFAYCGARTALFVLFHTNAKVAATNQSGSANETKLGAPH